jgi:trehalose 6-phosphate phosphatase
LKISNPEELFRQVLPIRPLWLFLDYDGTLADFAPTPETINPDPQINALLTRLVSKLDVRVAIISGRRLRDVQALVPVPGLYLAGTYGIEFLTPEGELIQRVKLETIRPFLEMIKPRWAEIIKGETGFYIEDKDWALALHAKFSQDSAAKRVLSLAREVVKQELAEEQIRILGGHKFLEIAPLLAHKGKTVSYLLKHYPLPKAQLVYIGDDDKDEEAFDVIQANQGLAIKVVNETQPTQPTRANYTLSSPAEVHTWLEMLFRHISDSSN